MTNENNKIREIPFSGKDYLLWKLRFLSYTDGMNWTQYLQPSTETLTAQQQQERCKLKATLVLSLSDLVLGNFSNEAEKTPDVLWAKITEVYERQNVESKHNLRDLMNNQVLGEDEDIESYCGRILQLAQRLRSAGDSPQDSDTIYAILKNLPPLYTSFASMLKLIPNLTTAQVVSHLMDHQLGLRQSITESKPKQLHFVSKKRTYQGNDDSTRNKKSAVSCAYCKKPNHHISECRTLKAKKQREAQQDQTNQSNSSQSIRNNSNNSATNLLAELETNSNEINDDGQDANHSVFLAHKPNKFPSNFWILDSGASNHFTNDIHDLKDVKQVDEVILTASAVQIKVAHVGTVQIQVNDQTITLTNVRYSPLFCAKIISISKLAQAKAIVTFCSTNVTVIFNNQIVMEGKKFKDLYIIKSISTKSLLMTVNLHSRLGHPNRQQMKQLLNACAFNNLKQDSCQDILFCEACQMGKASRTEFSHHSSEPASSRVMEKLHADICGPINVDDDPLGVLSLYGNVRYFVVIVDDFTGKIYIELLKVKSDATKAIIDFINLAETTTNQKLLKFHSDNGLEFNNVKLNSWMKSKSIVKTNSLPFTPQHNGVAERSIRTITESARTMIHHALLHPSFWPPAVKAASYLLGFRLKTSNTKTINELFFGFKQSINHLRTMFCDSFTHVPDHKRSKFDAKSILTIFIGYPDSKTNGYVLFDPNTKKLIESRDVTFLEESFTIGREILFPNKQTKLFDENKLTKLLQSADQNAQSATDTQPAQMQQTHQNQHPQISSNSTPSCVPTNPSNQSLNSRSIVDELMPARNTSVRTRAQRANQQYDCIDGHDIGDYGMLTYKEKDIPATYDEAMTSHQVDKWKTAIQSELEAHTKNNTFTAIPQSPKDQYVTARWIFTKKIGTGRETIFKARLVARGFQQLPHIHFEETYAPVIRYQSIRLILALGCQMGHEVYQMDIRTAFLNASIDEHILMLPPAGVNCPKNHVLKINRALYGLKQAPRAFNSLLNAFMIHCKFEPLYSDKCVYTKRLPHNSIMIVGIYVDDILISVNKKDLNYYHEFKHQIQQEFDTKDMGLMKLMLSMEITQSDTSITIKQSQLIRSLLKNQQMHECAAITCPETKGCKYEEHDGTAPPSVVKSYQSVIGSLNYITHATRPDICHSVNVLSRFASNPSKQHHAALKKILRYLRGTEDLGLTYVKSESTQISLVAFSDADWAADSTRRSVSGNIIKLNGNAIMWRTKRHKSIATSSAESEYIALSDTVKDVMWTEKILNEIIKTHIPIRIMCDNQATIFMVKNDAHSKSRHIDIKLMFTNNEITTREYQLDYCPSEQMEADIMTKGTDPSTFSRLAKKIMLY